MAEESLVKATDSAETENRTSNTLSRLLSRLIGRVESGSLCITLPSGRRIVVSGERPGLNADISVHRWSTFASIALGGDIGFAECLVSGDCSSRDLKTLLLWAMANSGASGSVGDGISTSRVLSRLRHTLHANTPRNSRRNIAAHYDLGNEFYRAWLDDDLNYSSGIYGPAATTLDEAQAAKNKRIADLLALRGGERVLEIGCGWGALAQQLVTQHQCDVTGLTLSEEQYAYAKKRLAGCGERAKILLHDYRDVTGLYDRIASIEMIEAVGEAFWPAYFGKIASCLASDGTAVLQAITIHESRYEEYRRRPDFIQLSVFPGGMLPTKSIIESQARHAGLQITRTEHFGASYARTLVDWRARFDQAWPSIQALGFDERFRRLWNYYLMYCEVGFETGWVDVGLYQIRHR